jgi:hypothetical protein
MYSAGTVDRQVLSWTTAGAFTSALLPLNVAAVTPAALGGGGGGGGGSVSFIGGGGRGGRWALLATPSSFWDVDALLAAAGISRPQVTQFYLDGTVGAGGLGGGAVQALGNGNVGRAGGVTTIRLVATVAGVARILASITTTAATGGQVGLGLDAIGGTACTGGNINLDGDTSESTRDLRLFLRGKTYSFRGGGQAAIGLGPGRSPGGGGTGGGISILLVAPAIDGQVGAAGVAHAIFTTDPTSRDPERDIIEPHTEGITDE